MRYLGLSRTMGQITTSNWLLVIEKEEQRWKGWQAKVLSRGGPPGADAVDSLSDPHFLSLGF